MLLLYIEEHWAQYPVFTLLFDYFWGAHIFKTLLFTYRTAFISNATCDGLSFCDDAYFFFALAEYLNSCYFAILFILGIFIWGYIAKLCVSIIKKFTEHLLKMHHDWEHVYKKDKTYIMSFKNPRTHKGLIKSNVNESRSKEIDLLCWSVVNSITLNFSQQRPVT